MAALRQGLEFVRRRCVLVGLVIPRLLAVGLPGADLWSGVDAFIVRMVDYGGLILGLWLCPWFNSALRKKENTGH